MSWKDPSTPTGTAERGAKLKVAANLEEETDINNIISIILNTLKGYSVTRAAMLTPSTLPHLHSLWQACLKQVFGVWDVRVSRWENIHKRQTGGTGNISIFHSRPPQSDLKKTSSSGNVMVGIDHKEYECGRHARNKKRAIFQMKYWSHLCCSGGGVKSFRA